MLSACAKIAVRCNCSLGLLHAPAPTPCDAASIVSLAVRLSNSSRTLNCSAVSSLADSQPATFCCLPTLPSGSHLSFPPPMQHRTPPEPLQHNPPLILHHLLHLIICALASILSRISRNVELTPMGESHVCTCSTTFLIPIFMRIM